MKATIFFLLCIASPLFGDIFDQLHPVPEPSEWCGVAGVDALYIINLDSRPEKYAMSVAELAPFHIKPCRFPAVSGWKLSTEQLNDIGIPFDPKTMRHGMGGETFDPTLENVPLQEIISVPGRRYFHEGLSRGAIGINVSHISLLAHAWKKGYKTLWIMEDDIQVVQNPHVMSKLMKKLDKKVGKKKWDILFTDPDTKDNLGNYIPCSGYYKMPNWEPKDPKRFDIRKTVGQHFTRVGARVGTYSYIIRRSGIKKILNFYRKYGTFLPYDLQFYLAKNLRLYCMRRDIVSTIPCALSDNGAPGCQR